MTCEFNYLALFFNGVIDYKSKVISASADLLVNFCFKNAFGRHDCFFLSPHSLCVMLRLYYTLKSSVSYCS